MKKFLLLFFASLLLAAPATILYYSMRYSGAMIQQEHEKQQLRNMQYKLMTLDRAKNPAVEIFRTLFLLLKDTENPAYKIFENQNVSNALRDYVKGYTQIQTANPWFKGEASLTYHQNDQDYTFNYKNGKLVSDSILAQVNQKLRIMQPFYQNKKNCDHLRSELVEMLADLLGGYLSPTFLDHGGDGRASQRIIIREGNLLKLLAFFRLDQALILTFSFDLSHVTLDLLARKMAAEWQNSETGLLFVDQKKPQNWVASSFFKDKEALAKTISRKIAIAKGRNLFFKHDGFQILGSDFDPKKQHHVVLAARVPLESRQPKMQLLIAFLAISGCFLLKWLCESLLMGRGQKIPLQLFISSIFVLVTMLPMLSSAYLANEFIVSNFKQTRNIVAEDLNNYLSSLDLETYANIRESINRAKSLNSLQALSEFSGLPETTPVNNLVHATMEKLKTINKRVFYSDVWIHEDNKDLFCIKYHQGWEKYYMDKSANPLLDEVFMPKFRDFMRQSKKIHDISEPKDSTKDIELSDLKSELFDSFILNMFGEKTYYKIREDFECLIKLESLMESNALLSIPVLDKGKPRFIFTWFLNMTEIRNHFPLNKLSLEKDKVTFSIYGSDRYIGAKPAPLSELGEKFPLLLKLGKQAHLLTSRLVMQENSVAGAPILAAIPARYSDFIICGQRNTRNLDEINSELVNTALGFFLIFALAALLLAGLTSLYFTLPIKQLIKATEQIISGNYSIRLGIDHPDEFGNAAVTFNKMAAGLEEGRLLSNFVSESVNELAEHEELSKTDIARNCEVTVLFSTIQHFHDIHQDSEVEKVFALLQEHLSAAVNAVTLYGGEIDKMIDDKVMIVFSSNNASHESSALAAVKVSMAISEALQKKFHVKTAAGINSGEVISGVMGTANVRLSKTVIGDTVNLAARLAAVAAELNEGGIVASGKTTSMITSAFACEKLPINRVKGKTHTVEAYQVRNLS